MQIDWTVNIGTAIQTVVVLAGVIGCYFAVMNKLDTFRIMMGVHANQLSEHSSKMADYERDLRDLVGSMQRITAEFGMYLRMRGERRISGKDNGI